MASETAKRLRDRRLNVWNEARKIAEDAANENRAFTPEEQGKWDAMQDEMRTLDTRIGAVLDTEKRAKAADDAFNDLEGRPREESREGQGGLGGKQLEEIRAWARGDQGASRALEIRRQGSGPVNYRTLLTTGSVSATVPTDFYDQLIAHLIEVSGVMQCGPTVLNTGGGETLQIPKTTAHSWPSTTGSAATQGQALPTSDPAFSFQSLSAFKYGTLLQVARELIDDTAVDLIGYLAMQAGRALGNAFGNDLVNGNGTTQPSGILTGATVGVTGVTGSGGAASYGNLIDLEYSVIAPYRQSRSCYWLAADKTIGSFRKLVDTTGRPIWEPSAVLGSPDLLLGKPLVADPFMPAVALSANSIAFGDFSQYFVRLVGGVRFERSDDFAFGSDVVTFRAILRGDGTLVDRTGAIKLLKGAASLWCSYFDVVSFLVCGEATREVPCRGSVRTYTRKYVLVRNAGGSSFSVSRGSSTVRRVVLTRSIQVRAGGSPHLAWIHGSARTLSAVRPMSRTGLASGLAHGFASVRSRESGRRITLPGVRPRHVNGRMSGVVLTRTSRSGSGRTTVKWCLHVTGLPRRSTRRN